MVASSLRCTGWSRSLTWLTLAVVAPLPLGGCGGEDGPGMMAEAPAPPLVFPDEPFRATRPAPAAARPFVPPMPEQFRLPNGIEVMLVEGHTTPIVNWQIVFPRPTVGDPPGKEGLASLCMNVFFQGSRALARSARDLALADMASSVGIGSGAHFVTFTAESLRPHLSATRDIWADLFLDSGLAQGPFDGTLQARVRVLATGASATPSSIAGRVADRLVWGPGHPYVREATVASFQAITLADCQTFLAEVVRPQGARLLIAGDITRAEVLTEFDRLNKLAGAALVAMPGPPPAPVMGTLFFVDSPGAPQSIISLRGQAPGRASAEYYPANIMAGILAGSSITSRIGRNVREMKGFAYSIGGGFVYSRLGGYFDLWAPVRSDASAESVVEILEEIQKLRTGGVTDEELTLERNGRVAGLPYAFETPTGILGMYEGILQYGLPLDYFAQQAVSFAAVTRDSVQQASGYLAPDKLKILVVGDGASILPKLRALAAMRPDLMGTQVIVLDRDGNRIGG